MCFDNTLFVFVVIQEYIDVFQEPFVVFADIGHRMASTPGQNVHLDLPYNHVLVSFSHLANSSSQLVLSSCRLF